MPRNCPEHADERLRQGSASDDATDQQMHLRAERALLRGRGRGGASELAHEMRFDVAQLNTSPMARALPIEAATIAALSAACVIVTICVAVRGGLAGGLACMLAASGRHPHQPREQ